MPDPEQRRLRHDYLIIGSGMAGLTAALEAADHGSVALITKKRAADCNTTYAQGGLACVIDPTDSFDSHVEDTLIAGAGLCDAEVVRRIVSDGPPRVRELIEMGVRFTRGIDLEEDGDEGFDLAREGGHSERRILHCGDITGRELVRVLLDRVRSHPKIEVFEGFHAVDLISTRRLEWEGKNHCLGAYVLDPKTRAVHTFLAGFTVLATGGAGKVYLYTSNPDVACGEGVAMAYRAYAEIANMEFYQFHPTCLYHPNAKSFLISEAVRGEGAVLKVKRDGEFVSFMDAYHQLGSLAPRDIVARAIDRELKRSGQACVYLDIRHHDEGFLRRRFPNIFATCLGFGINMATDPIPVVPAAHYCCGGVRTDTDGRTCIGNLYAAGEVGHTGLHGANRLAINSLLEALVVAHNAITHSRDAGLPDGHLHDQVPDWGRGNAVDSDELIVISQNWDEIRRFMWDYVGIFRTTKRLQRAKSRVRNIRKEIEHFYWDFILTADLIELRNMASVAEMIIDSAMAREASIGLHFNVDFPVLDAADTLGETILRRPGF